MGISVSPDLEVTWLIFAATIFRVRRRFEAWCRSADSELSDTEPMSVFTMGLADLAYPW